MPTLRSIYQDPFSPVLFTSTTLAVSVEQKEYVKKILDKACSDSRFAEKAYIAITKVLTGGSATIPTVTSLTPSSAEVGDPSFLLHVHGTNFTSTSKIVFNGGEEVTTYVSASELTTTVDMTTVLGPAVVTVAVLSGEVLSDTMNFTFTDGTPLADSMKKQAVKDKVIENKVKEVTTDMKDAHLKEEDLKKGDSKK